eukprot:11161503-Lingulodinium_polyedra.AAC.1
MPMALFGADVASLLEVPLRGLSTVLVDLGSGTQFPLRSPAVAAVFAAGNIPVDIEAEAFVLFVLSLRRFAADNDE